MNIISHHGGSRHDPRRRVSAGSATSSYSSDSDSSTSSSSSSSEDDDDESDHDNDEESLCIVGNSKKNMCGYSDRYTSQASVRSGGSIPSGGNHHINQHHHDDVCHSSSTESSCAIYSIHQEQASFAEGSCFSFPYQEDGSCSTYDHEEDDDDNMSMTSTTYTNSLDDVRYLWKNQNHNNHKKKDRATTTTPSSLTLHQSVCSLISLVTDDDDDDGDYKMNHHQKKKIHSPPRRRVLRKKTQDTIGTSETVKYIRECAVVVGSVNALLDSCPKPQQQQEQESCQSLLDQSKSSLFLSPPKTHHLVEIKKGKDDDDHTDYGDDMDSLYDLSITFSLQGNKNRQKLESLSSLSTLTYPSCFPSPSQTSSSTMSTTTFVALGGDHDDDLTGEADDYYNQEYLVSPCTPRRNYYGRTAAHPTMSMSMRYHSKRNHAISHGMMLTPKRIRHGAAAAAPGRPGGHGNTKPASSHPAPTLLSSIGGLPWSVNEKNPPTQQHSSSSLLSAKSTTNQNDDDDDDDEYIHNDDHLDDDTITAHDDDDNHDESKQSSSQQPSITTVMTEPTKKTSHVINTKEQQQQQQNQTNEELNNAMLAPLSIQAMELNDHNNNSDNRTKIHHRRHHHHVGSIDKPLLTPRRHRSNEGYVFDIDHNDRKEHDNHHHDEECNVTKNSHNKNHPIVMTQRHLLVPSENISGYHAKNIPTSSTGAFQTPRCPIRTKSTTNSPLSTLSSSSMPALSVSPPPPVAGAVDTPRYPVRTQSTSSDREQPPRTFRLPALLVSPCSPRMATGTTPRYPTRTKSIDPPLTFLPKIWDSPTTPTTEIMSSSEHSNLREEEELVACPIKTKKVVQQHIEEEQQPEYQHDEEPREEEEEHKQQHEEQMESRQEQQPVSN